MSEQQTKATLSRRDFLKFVGIAAGAGAIAGLGVQPEVQKKVGEAISKGASALDEQLRKIEIYEKLAEGKAAVRLDMYESEAGTQTWQALLQSPAGKGVYYTLELQDDSSLLLNPESTEVEYVSKQEPVTLSYDANSESGPKVWLETEEGKKVQIAPYKFEFTNQEGGIESGVSLEYLDENGKLSNIRNARSLINIAFLFAATKELTERGYNTVSAVLTVSTGKNNGELLGIDFVEIWSNDNGLLRYPIIKGTKGSESTGIQAEDYFRPEWTGTGFRYFAENRPGDVITGKVEPLPNLEK